MSSNLKEKIHGSIMATAGYLLSPLSWWNDLYVNVPIAYGLAWMVSSITDKRYFGVLVVFFYWLSNLAGLLLLHKGVALVVKDNDQVSQLRKRVMLDILLSLAYSAILALLVYAGILKHPEDYLK
jgi:hypothetical protein